MRYRALLAAAVLALLPSGDRMEGAAKREYLELFRLERAAEPYAPQLCPFRYGKRMYFASVSTEGAVGIAGTEPLPAAFKRAEEGRECASVATLQMGKYPRPQVRAGDLDGDGTDEVVVLKPDGTLALVALDGKAPQFLFEEKRLGALPAEALGKEYTATGFSLTDANGDGRTDIVVVDFKRDVTAYLNRNAQKRKR